MLKDIKVQSGTIKIFNQVWFINLIVVLLLSSQFLILEHSTEHSFHAQSDYCLTFQTANASPTLITPVINFQLPEKQFENILCTTVYTLVVPFRKNFSTRAPPLFV